MILMALSMQRQCLLCSGKIEFVNTDFIWMETTQSESFWMHWYNLRIDVNDTDI